MLPELWAIHRQRDVELRGASLLDDPAHAAFQRSVILDHAARWSLLTVCIDRAIAGYDLCLRDSAVLRVWDNRVSPRWSRYSAGLLANAELVRRAAADPTIDSIDWGRGDQRYKSSLATGSEHAVRFTAWSSTLCRRAILSRQAMRRVLTREAP